MCRPKSPPPPDFCNSPCCPKCFVHDTPEGEEISGQTKMRREWLELLKVERLTDEQEIELDDIAVRIHERNKQVQADPGTYFHEEDTRQGLQRQLNAAAKQRELDANRPKPTPRKKGLDEIDVEAIIKKEQKSKARAEAADRAVGLGKSSWVMQYFDENDYVRVFVDPATNGVPEPAPMSYVEGRLASGEPFRVAYVSVPGDPVETEKRKKAAQSQLNQRINNSMRKAYAR